MKIQSYVAVLFVMLIPLVGTAEEPALGTDSGAVKVSDAERHKKAQWRLGFLRSAVESEARDEVWASAFERVVEKNLGSAEGVTLHSNQCGTTICYVDLHVAGEGFGLEAPMHKTIEELHQVSSELGESGNIRLHQLSKDEKGKVHLRMFYSRAGYKLPDAGVSPDGFVPTEKL